MQLSHIDILKLSLGLHSLDPSVADCLVECVTFQLLTIMARLLLEAGGTHLIVKVPR